MIDIDSFNTDYFSKVEDIMLSSVWNMPLNKEPEEEQVVDIDEEDKTLSLNKRPSDVEKKQRESNMRRIKYAISGYRVQSVRIWKGNIISIDEDQFSARLVEVSGAYKPRVVSIKKSVVNRLDWDEFFHIGHEFDWVFRDVWKNGGLTKDNEIRFTPTPRYSLFEVEKHVKEKMDRFSYMMSDDD